MGRAWGPETGEGKGEFKLPGFGVILTYFQARGWSEILRSLILALLLGL